MTTTPEDTKTQTRRKTLLVIELYERKHGRPPTWTEIRRLSGGKRGRDFSYLMMGLRKKGLVRFTDGQERSTHVTEMGLRAALKQP